MDLHNVFSVFALVFIAELGDKTQLVTLSMTGSSGSPWPVFFGSATALTASTAIAVFAGGTTGTLIPKIAPPLTAGLFLIFGLWILFRKPLPPLKQALLQAHILETDEARVLRKIVAKTGMNRTVSEQLYHEELQHAKEFRRILNENRLLNDDLNNDPVITELADRMQFPGRIYKKKAPQILSALIEAEQACLDFYNHLLNHLQEPHHRKETAFREFLEKTITEEQKHIALFRSILSEKTPSAENVKTEKRNKSLFITAFLLVFLAELGDKTQLTAFSASAATAAPWAVFIGASTALILSSLIAITIGKWLSSRIRERTMALISSCLFLGAGVFLFLRHFGVL